MNVFLISDKAPDSFEFCGDLLSDVVSGLPGPTLIEVDFRFLFDKVQRNLVLENMQSANCFLLDCDYIRALSADTKWHEIEGTLMAIGMGMAEGPRFICITCNSLCCEKRFWVCDVVIECRTPWLKNFMSESTMSVPISNVKDLKATLSVAYTDFIVETL